MTSGRRCWWGAAGGVHKSTRRMGRAPLGVRAVHQDQGQARRHAPLPTITRCRLCTRRSTRPLAGPPPCGRSRQQWLRASWQSSKQQHGRRGARRLRRTGRWPAYLVPQQEPGSRAMPAHKVRPAVDAAQGVTRRDTRHAWHALAAAVHSACARHALSYYAPPAGPLPSSASPDQEVMFGIMAGSVRVGVRALRDWCQALGLPYVRPVSRVSARGGSHALPCASTQRGQRCAQLGPSLPVSSRVPRPCRNRWMARRSWRPLGAACT